jgi:hypothetical protein
MHPKDSLKCALRAVAELRKGTPQGPPRLREMWFVAIAEVNDVIAELNRVSVGKAGTKP